MKTLLNFSLLTLILISACKKESPTSINQVAYQVTDIDGNKYDTVRIGSQVWLKQNLTTTHFRNGDSINELVDSASWVNAQSGAWCYPYGDSAGYGKLYNWYAATDLRGIAPSGWHVPSDSDWTVLMNYVNDNSGHLKSTNDWIYSNYEGDNLTGFTALPAGYRASGIYSYEGYYAFFWTTSSEYSNGIFFHLDYGDSFTTESNFGKSFGFSIRCIQD